MGSKVDRWVLYLRVSNISRIEFNEKVICSICPPYENRKNIDCNRQREKLK